MGQLASTSMDPLGILAGHAAAARYRDRRPLRLHLNPGAVAVDGWLRVGVLPDAGDGSGPDLDLALDLRGGLPFDDGSVELIYAWLVADRLGELALPFLVDAARVLQPGGRLRLVGRDRAPAEAEIQRLVAQGIMPLDRLRHLPAWSAADLLALLFGVGFGRVTQVAPDASDDPRLTGLESRHGLPLDEGPTWFVLEATR
jgi:hypothetical protein